jgi:lysophospholipase L1-like esterase
MVSYLLSGWLALGSSVAGGNFVECTSSGYSRQPISFLAVDNMRVTNSTAGVFPNAGTGGPLGLYAALADAPSGGNLLCYWQILHTKALPRGSSWSFAPGDFSLQIPSLGTSSAFFEPGAEMGQTREGACIIAATRLNLANGALSALPLPRTDDVTTRAPCYNDDASRGYTPGNLWLSPSGTLYQAIATTPGLSAVWPPFAGESSTSLNYPASSSSTVPFIGSAARPLDIQTIGPFGFAYGTRLLSSAYSGPAFTVQRLSDNTTKNIGFLADGSLDTQSLDGFLAGSCGRIITWFDQSGNGINATQSNVQNAPTIVPLRRLGNARSVMFDARPEGNGSSEPYCGPTQTTLTISMPTGSTLSGSAVSIYAIGGIQSAGHNTSFFSLSDSNGHLLIVGANWQWSAPGAASGVAALGGGPPAFGPGLGGMDTPNVVSLISGSSGASFYHNDGQSSGKLAIGTITGGTLGASAFGSAMGFVDLAAVIVYPAAHTQMQQMSILASLYSQFAIRPQVRDVFVADGDSHTDGYGASFQQTWLRKMGSMLNRPSLALANVAVYGETAATRLQNFSANVAPALSRSARNKVVALYAGWNDIAILSTTPQQLLQIYQEYGALVHQYGAKFLAVGSPLRGASSAQIAVMQQFNALLAENWQGFADGFVDLSQCNPGLGLTSGWGSGTPNLFFSDTIHFNDAGYSAIGAAVAKALAPMLV